jgi:hypothetical protein
LEWRLAAQWGNYTFEQFCNLEGDEQSDVVATYRTHLQIESVVAYEQSRQSNKKGRKK